MIKSFKCEHTEKLSKGNHVKRFSNIAKVARRKLRQIEISGRRINDQWRVCFCWTDAGAENVEIVDYH
ncbi:MAG: excinuclease ABC subunit A [Desulfobacteraceae bacterium IS3]|nr:MAG: excinuclease ABC subunit A [Desulfobacteraceae bacterium IS3]